MENNAEYNKTITDRFSPGLFLVLFSFTVIIIQFGCSEKAENAISKLGEKSIPYNKTSFLESARKGDTEAVMLFLDAGMDPNVSSDDGTTALMAAVTVIIPFFL